MWLVGVTVCVVFFLGGETKVAKGRTRKKKKKRKRRGRNKRKLYYKIDKGSLDGPW